MKKRILTIANQKGGVGKTTTAFNLGAALSVKQGLKVLLIDLDPQANLSEYLSYTEDDKPTMTQLIAEVARRTVISPEKVLNAIRYNENNKLYYIPSDINLASAETIMTTAISRETILKRILSDEVVKDFDYVIIDCLPSLGVLLLNALTAATKIIIPVQTQKFSLDGLETLTALCRQVKTTINPDLKILGILPTMVDNTNVSKNALRSLSEQYHNLFKTIIHKSVEAAKSAENGTALCRLKNRLGEEYASLAQEVRFVEEFQ